MKSAKSASWSPHPCILVSTPTSHTSPYSQLLFYDGGGGGHQGWSTDAFNNKQVCETGTPLRGCSSNKQLSQNRGRNLTETRQKARSSPWGMRIPGGSRRRPRLLLPLRAFVFLGIHPALRPHQGVTSHRLAIWREPISFSLLNYFHISL